MQAFVQRNEKKHAIRIVHDSQDLAGGTFLFLVSCHETIPESVRTSYRHCLVLHASDLPVGRGWSPHIWTVLAGTNNITLSLLSAADGIDTGDIWKKIFVILEGHELYDEINDKIFEAEVELMAWALENLHRIQPVPQIGSPSYHRKRTPEDSKLDPSKSIASQFDLLRVADPHRYPAFFEMRGHKYKLVISKLER